jgi:hypothetical protein
MHALPPPAKDYLWRVARVRRARPADLRWRGGPDGIFLSDFEQGQIGPERAERESNDR